MSAPLRVGGRGRLADGGLVTWSVAEGVRGRRWRGSLTDGDELRAIALLELDRDGRPSRLELATSSGLLTMHPEPDGVLHGNVVTALGIRPITQPVGDRFVLDVDRLPIAAAAACHALSEAVGTGEETDLTIVRIGLDLTLSSVTGRVARPVPDGWTIEGSPLAVDGRGVPLLADAEEWPLEADDGGGEPVA